MSETAANSQQHTTDNTDPVETVAAAPDVQGPADFGDDNPFTEADTDPSTGSSVATATPERERVKLAPAFHSIADQLPDQAKAKLKACDVTVAQVILQRDMGAELEPLRMAQVMGRDFATNCARRTGGAGWITVQVLEPKKLPWSFGFEYVAQAGEQAEQENPLLAQKRLLDAYLAEFRRLAEDVKLEAALGGGRRNGGDSTREMLRELKELGVLGGQQQQQGNGLAEMVQAMAALQEFSNKSTANAFNGALAQKDMLEKLGVGKAPEQTAAQQLKDVLDIPVVADIAKAGTDAVVKRMLNPKDKASTPEVTGQPGAIDDSENPFAESA